MAQVRRMVHHGRDRVQISPWKASSEIANLVPFAARDVVSLDMVRHATNAALNQGYHYSYTAALAPAQAEPFLVLGFEVYEELHLLRRTLDAEPSVERGITRRARRTDWDDVLELDALAFEPFWQFDRTALTDAINATPRHRFQVTKTAPVVGYHVVGLAGSNSYLQRVAVHPDAHGQGWGTHLVNHASRWAWRHGASSCHVNTQLTNHKAVALYEKCGFVEAPYRLQVLHRSLV